jgi:hypothetical protein
MLQLHNPFDVPIQISVAETIPSGPRAQAMVHDMLVAGSRGSPPQSQGDADGEPIALLHLFARDIAEVCMCKHVSRLVGVGVVLLC